MRFFVKRKKFDFFLDNHVTADVINIVAQNQRLKQRNEELEVYNQKLERELATVGGYLRALLKRIEQVQVQVQVNVGEQYFSSPAFLQGPQTTTHFNPPQYAAPQYHTTPSTMVPTTAHPSQFATPRTNYQYQSSPFATAPKPNPSNSTSSSVKFEGNKQM